MTKDKWKAKTPFLIVCLLILFHLVGNCVWIYLNNKPPAWDQAAHTSKSILFSHFISTGNGTDLTAALDTHYGPFVFFITGGIMTVTGISIKIAQLVGTIFFIGSLIALYFIAKDILRSKWIGVFAVFIFSFGQIIYGYSRWLLLDIPIVFFVLWGTYFFIKSRVLEDRIPALLMFIFITMAAYTKIQAITYFIFPIIYALFISVKQRNKKIVLNLALGILFVVLLSLPWVLYRWSAILNYYSIVSMIEPGAYPTNMFSIQYWLHYLKLVTNQIFTAPILCIILLMGFVSGRKTKYPWVFFLLIQSVFIYITYSFLVHKDIRYIFPSVAFFSLIAGVWIKSFVKQYRFLGIVFLLLIAYLSLSQYITSSFGYPYMLSNQFVEINLPVVDDITIYNTKGEWPVEKYNFGPYPQIAVLSYFDDVIKQKDKKIRVAVLISLPEFNGNNMYMYSLTKKSNTDIEFGGIGAYVFPSLLEVEDYLNSFDYLLFTPDISHMSYQLDAQAYDQVNTVITKKLKNGLLQTAATYVFPSGSRLWLLKKSEPTL